MRVPVLGLALAVLLARPVLAQQTGAPAGPTRQVLEASPGAPGQPGAIPEQTGPGPVADPGQPGRRPPPPVVTSIHVGSSDISLPAPFEYCLPDRSRATEASFLARFADRGPNVAVFVRCADLEAARQSGQALNAQNFLIVAPNADLDSAKTGLQRREISGAVCDEVRRQSGDFPIAATPQWSEGLKAAAQGKGSDFSPVIGSTQRACITASVLPQGQIAIGATTVVRTKGLVIVHVDPRRQQPVSLRAQYNRVANFVGAIVAVNQGPATAFVPGAAPAVVPATP